MSASSKMNDSYESGHLSEPKTCSVASVFSFPKDISLMCQFFWVYEEHYELLWAGSS